MLKTEKGFTLIELMVLIAIISIIATVLIPTCIKYKQDKLNNINFDNNYQLSR